MLAAVRTTPLLPPMLRHAAMPAALLAVLAGSLTACGSTPSSGGTAASSSADTGGAAAPASDFEHVHGLGINPADGALFIATHGGLFRAPRGQRSAKRVGDSAQDVMGFTVVGPDRFLGSGHPDPSAGGPTDLGLIRTTSAGRNWDTVSLGGRADFHVLRAAGQVVYGFNGMTGKLMRSRDRGRSWTTHESPAGMFDLAISPSDGRRVVISTERGLFSSADGGAHWRSLDPQRAGLLTWTSHGVYLVGGDGTVSTSTDRGRTWKPRGSIAGQPAAFASDGPRLYAARADGTVVQSTDAGATWTIRARP